MLDAPEYSGVYRPVISEQEAEIMQTSAEDLNDLNSSISGDPESFLQVFVTVSSIESKMQTECSLFKLRSDFRVELSVVRI